MIKVGESYSKKFEVTDEIIQEIARVSGDVNPVHLNEKYAQNTIFGKRIAHGLFCLNSISMIIGNYFPGRGSILLEQSFKYMRPAYIGDIVETTITVNDIVKEKNIYVLGTVCVNQERKEILTGISKVKWENDENEIV